MSLPPPLGGRPPKTERPHRIPREHPITHHVTDPPHGEVADRDKPGRPRAPHPASPPRSRPAPAPDVSTQQHHRALDAEPPAQISGSCPRDPSAGYRHNTPIRPSTRASHTDRPPIPGSPRWARLVRTSTRPQSPKRAPNRTKATASSRGRPTAMALFAGLSTATTPPCESLKIVVSPVRVRVSPSREALHTAGIAAPGLLVERGDPRLLAPRRLFVAFSGRIWAP